MSMPAPKVMAQTEKSALVVESPNWPLAVAAGEVVPGQDHRDAPGEADDHEAVRNPSGRGGVATPERTSARTQEPVRDEGRDQELRSLVTRFVSSYRTLARMGHIITSRPLAIGRATEPMLTASSASSSPSTV